MKSHGYTFLGALLCMSGASALSKNCSDILASKYQNYSEIALDRLQEWYRNDTGLWTSYDPSWWQSANALTTVIDMAAAGSSKAKTIADWVVPNTFTTAAAVNIENNHALRRQEENGYVNNYYDDEGWWAVAWMEAYDLYKTQDYLDTAELLFEDMAGGWGTNCSNGGIWWDKAKTGISSISDTLFIQTAAWLANRVGDDKKQHYVDWAVKAWTWFNSSIEYEPENHFIRGGIDVVTCQLPKDDNAFTYSHGVLVSGLTALWQATGETVYLDEAHGVASRVLTNMTKDGVLEEPRIDQAHPGQAAPQFKGVFMRGMAYLNSVSPRDAYATLARKSADSIWNNDRNNTADLGPYWQGPFYGDANASPHSSAMDALVAAWRATKSA